MVTVATPLELVKTEPAVGLKVARLAVNVTTAPATGLPNSSTTVAFNVPGLSTEMDVVAVPEPSVNDKVTLGWPVGVVPPPLLPPPVEPEEVEKASLPPHPATKAMVSSTIVFLIKLFMCCNASAKQLMIKSYHPMKMFRYFQI